MAEERTIVVFRTYPDGEVIALFPEIPADPGGLHCSSYMHHGQHGAASCPVVFGQTTPASPKEYAALKRELESIGYDLEVRSRVSPKMREARRKDV